MNLAADTFFAHVDNFMEYRETVYEISANTSRSNRIDLDLFQEFVKERALDAITGPAVMDFQFYLKKRRHNCGASINRKLFTLRTYAKYLECQQVAKDLPFRDILKVKQGYRNQPHALTQEQLKTFFESVDRTSIIGIRDYCIYALMYGLGLRVGEVFRLDLSDLDIENKRITVIGKGGRRRNLHLAEKLVQIITEWIAVRKSFLNSDKSSALFLSKKGLRLFIRTMEDLQTE
jgi:integrase/recombinase XerC/integrase/recombinase XerD